MTSFSVARDAICRRVGKSAPSKNSTNDNKKNVAPLGAGPVSNDNTDALKKGELHASCVGGVPALTGGTTTTTPAAHDPLSEDAVIGGGVGKPQRTNKRAHPLSIRVTQQLRDDAERKAYEAGLSLNRFGHAALIAAVYGEEFLTPIAPERLEQCEVSLHKLLVELARQGNNLNQITVNTNKAELRGQGQPEATKELQAIRRNLDDMVFWLTKMQGLIDSVKLPSTINDNEPRP